MVIGKHLKLVEASQRQLLFDYYNGLE